MDLSKEYVARLAQWTEKAKAYENSHHWIGSLRFLLFIVLLAIVIALCRSWLSIGIGIQFLMLGLFLSGLVHDRILRDRDKARCAVRFYQAGIDRLAGNWAGKGSPGTEFLDPHHPYAADLDLFGPGSLFELINAAQTQSGRATLAAWLNQPASAEEIRGRQAAIDELKPRLDLRERLGQLTAETQAWIKTEPLIAWAQQPPRLQFNLARTLLFCLPFLTLGVFLVLGWRWTLFSLMGQYLVARHFQERVHQVTRSITSVQRDLKWLSEIFHCLEQEKFQSERFRRMDAACQCNGISPSQAIHRLARLYEWLTSAENLLFVIICKWLMWETQFAFAIEAWRGRFGPKIEPWLSRLAETEALSSLAGYAFEHPADSFPEFLPATAPAQFEAEGLGHPLIAESRCVRNGAFLGPNQRLIVVSGSNMSGKSTYLRAIGVNMVLAMAGATVRARRLRLTPLQLGASIRTLDSLQEGTSRFYAEIKRLGQIVALAGQNPPLVFLLDEILGGTNSHDRRIGAACVARSLLKRGTLGLITTHDLALTKIAEEMQPPGANYHFEDQFRDGRMTFDYSLRPGIVQKSNALELMRSVGLDITE